MAERDMRQRVIRALRELDAISVENRCGLGTPDVNYVEGWIECKWLRKWPKRPETVVKLDHELMAGQRAWIKRRAKRDGDVFVLLQCGREWLLIEGHYAACELGKQTREQLIESCAAYWKNGLNDDELVEVLRGRA